jgi:3-phenylpropionate/trans-cinnamate dioxygenase ferredoxin reductase component
VLVALIGEEAHLPYERPPLSKDVMTAAETPPAKTIATAEHLAQQGIAFVRGHLAARIPK